mgnify:CR=1 FL=1
MADFFLLMPWWTEWNITQKNVRAQSRSKFSLIFYKKYCSHLRNLKSNTDVKEFCGAAWKLFHPKATHRRSIFSLIFHRCRVCNILYIWLYLAPFADLVRSTAVGVTSSPDQFLQSVKCIIWYISSISQSTLSITSLQPSTTCLGTL